MGFYDLSTVRSRGTRIRTEKIVFFLALTFGIAWTGAIVLYLGDIELGSTVGLILLIGMYMWAPAIAAILTQLRYGESIPDACGLRFGRLRWAVLGWLAPVLLIGATIGIGSLIPGITIVTDYGAYLVELGLTEEQAAEAVAQLDALPLPALVVFVMQGLFAGLTINALAAVGEEIGWRGLLLTELAPLGFWKLSVVTGAIWGIWHAPIILQGHNFPDAPVAGVFVMMMATIAMAPILTYITVRARSVLAPTFFHGSLNGLGALSLVYLTGAGTLLIAPVGLAGIGAALLLVALCVIHDQLVANEQIITTGPLSAWE